MVGPDTYDPKAEHEEFQRLLQRRPAPTGILISPADPTILGPDIESALKQGIPVITIDSDAPSGAASSLHRNRQLQSGLNGGQLTAKLLQGEGPWWYSECRAA